MSTYSEILGNGNGNGHTNGNGKPKIFTLSPAQDELTFTILETRRNALADPLLSTSAKAFFAQLLDLSLNRNVNDRPGVVTISQPRLAETFQVSARSIFTWKRQLEQGGYVWMSKRFVPNMWPLDTYHITAIDPPKSHEDKPTREGMWGNGDTRSAPSNPGLGARKPGQRSFKLPGSKTRPAAPAAKNGKTPNIAAASGKSLRPPAEEKIGCHPKKSSGASRRKLRAAAEENCGSEPKKSSGGSRSQLRVAAAANGELKRGSGKRIETDLGGKAVPAPPVSALSPKPGPRPFDSELPRMIAEQKQLIKSLPPEDTVLPALYDRLRELEGFKYGAPITEPGAFHKPKKGAKPSDPIPAPTEDELLSGVRYLISIGKEHLFTEAQREAAAKL